MTRTCLDMGTGSSRLQRRSPISPAREIAESRMGLMWIGSSERFGFRRWQFLRHSEFGLRHLSGNPPAKWVPVVQQQRRLRSDKGRADDGRHNRARGPVEPAIARGEKTANDALLHP